mgnify:CR=1 FL=1
MPDLEEYKKWYQTQYGEVGQRWAEKRFGTNPFEANLETNPYYQYWLSNQKGITKEEFGTMSEEVVRQYFYDLSRFLGSTPQQSEQLVKRWDETRGTTEERVFWDILGDSIQKAQLSEETKKTLLKQQQEAQIYGLSLRQPAGAFQPNIQQGPSGAFYSTVIGPKFGESSMPQGALRSQLIGKVGETEFYAPPEGWVPPSEEAIAGFGGGGAELGRMSLRKANEIGERFGVSDYLIPYLRRQAEKGEDTILIKSVYALAAQALKPEVEAIKKQYPGEMAALLPRWKGADEEDVLENMARDPKLMPRFLALRGKYENYKSGMQFRQKIEGLAFAEEQRSRLEKETEEEAWKKLTNRAQKVFKI